MTKSWAVPLLGTLFALGAGCGASHDPTPASTQLLTPDATGWVDKAGTGTTGIQGQWRVFADSVAGIASFTAGTCHSVDYGECSTVREPAPDRAYAPTPGLGMCTSGVIAKWIGVVGAQGITPDGSSGRAGIVLDLNTPDWPEPHAALQAPTGQPYDAEAHSVIGFAFDIDSEPAARARLRVEVGPLHESPSPPAYWGGAQMDASPVHAGHNEFRWSDVGPNPFSPSGLLSLRFVLSGSEAQPVSYNFCIDHLSALRGGSSTSDSTFGDQLLTPDETGEVTKSMTGKTEIQGAWITASDGQAACPEAGHTACSVISEPDPNAPIYPPTKDLGMCTSGVVAKGTGADGIWGAMIGFLLNATASGTYPYDAEAHGLTGFAFDLDSEPAPGAEINVELATEATQANAASWGGKTKHYSPVHAGHNEFRWRDVGGPWYLSNPPAFDPRKLVQVGFHVLPNPEYEVSYRFCIQNLTALGH